MDEENLGEVLTSLCYGRLWCVGGRVMTYLNRAPRHDVSFPLEFRLQDAVVSGHCLNISESGLLGVFGEPLELWTQGELLLRFGESACTVAARVVRAQEFEAGLAFSFSSDSERAAIRSMLVQANQRSHLVGRPPF